MNNSSSRLQSAGFVSMSSSPHTDGGLLPGGCVYTQQRTPSPRLRLEPLSEVTCPSDPPGPRAHTLSLYPALRAPGRLPGQAAWAPALSRDRAVTTAGRVLGRGGGQALVWPLLVASSTANCLHVRHESSRLHRRAYLSYELPAPPRGSASTRVSVPGAPSAEQPVPAGRGGPPTGGGLAFRLVKKTHSFARLSLAVGVSQVHWQPRPDLGLPRLWGATVSTPLPAGDPTLALPGVGAREGSGVN